MSSLTCYLERGMIALATAKSVVGILPLLKTRRAYSRSRNAAFFVPVIFVGTENSHFYGYCLGLKLGNQWIAVTSAELGNQYDGCGRPFQYPPYSTTTDVEGYNNNLSAEVFVMCDDVPVSSPFAPEDCFSVSLSELASFPFDPVFVGVSRASALLRLLMDSSDGLAESGSFSISHADVMSNLWLLQLCLRQVEDVLEAWCNDDSVNK